MSMPKDELQDQMTQAWNTYLDNLEKSMNLLDKQIKEAKEMTSVCTDEWCEATEHYLDDLGNALFSISEPRWLNEDDSRRIKALKRRVYDIYADYRGVYESVR